MSDDGSQKRTPDGMAKQRVELSVEGRRGLLDLIKRQMKDKQISQVMLAKKLNLPLGTVRNYLQDKRTGPDPFVYIASGLADAVGTTPQDILRAAKILPDIDEGGAHESEAVARLLQVLEPVSAELEQVRGLYGRSVLSVAMDKLTAAGYAIRIRNSFNGLEATRVLRARWLDLVPPVETFLSLHLPDPPDELIQQQTDAATPKGSAPRQEERQTGTDRAVVMTILGKDWFVFQGLRWSLSWRRAMDGRTTRDDLILLVPDLLSSLPLDRDRAADLRYPSIVVASVMGGHKEVARLLASYLGWRYVDVEQELLRQRELRPDQDPYGEQQLRIVRRYVEEPWVSSRARSVLAWSSVKALPQLVEMLRAQTPTRHRLRAYVLRPDEATVVHHSQLFPGHGVDEAADLANGLPASSKSMVGAAPYALPESGWDTADNKLLNPEVTPQMLEHLDLRDDLRFDRYAHIAYDLAREIEGHGGPPVRDDSGLLGRMSRSGG